MGAEIQYFLFDVYAIVSSFGVALVRGIINGGFYKLLAAIEVAKSYEAFRRMDVLSAREHLLHAAIYFSAVPH